MSLVDTALAAGYCRASPADPKLPVQLGAAERFVVDFLNRQVFADQATLDAAVTTGTAGDLPMVVNDAIRAGILEYLVALYDNRGEEAEERVRRLVFPYRVGLGV